MKSVRDAGVVSAVVAVLVYLNSLDCGMVYDDEYAIKWNQDIRPHTKWTHLLVHDFWGASLSNPISHKSYRPLCVATFRLNYMLHGLDPMGYHLVNVLLHAVVCYLYVQLCGVIFTEVWPALIAGLLFAVHPIHTEAVTGIVGRAELLSGILYLSAILSYRRALTSQTQGHVSWLLVSISLGFGVCAMLSKEQGITALPLCLVYDFFIFNHLKLAYIFGRISSLKPSLFEVSTKVKRFFVRGMVVSATALVAIVMRLMISNGAPSEKIFNMSVNPPLSQNSPYRQMSWAYLIFVNVWLLLNPSTLSIDWRYGAVPLINSVCNWNNVLTLITIIVIAGITVYGLSKLENTHETVLLGISLMVFPFIPASNIFFPVGFVVAERVLYLPSMGYCMLVAYGTWKMLNKKVSRNFGLLLRVMLGCLLLVYGVKTMVRNRDWYSASTIHTAGVKFNPTNAVLLSNLGIEHAIKGDYSQAELLYLSSMQITPSFSGGYHNYGMLMKLLHRYEEAEQPLLKAIELGQYDTSERKMAERYNLLVTVISMNHSRLNEALELSQHVLKEHPDYTIMYATRCSIIIKLNRTADFIHDCDLAVRMNPGLSNAHYNLGIACMKLGYLSQAEVSFRNMLVLDSGSLVAMFHLATVLQNTGRIKDMLEARNLWQHVLIREPQNIEALMSLALVNSELHYYSQALEALENVLQVNPNHQEALYRAGKLLYRQRHYEEAVSLLSRLNGTDTGRYLDIESLLNNAKFKGTISEFN